MDSNFQVIEWNGGEAEPTFHSESASSDNQLALLAQDFYFDSFQRLFHILTPKFNLLQLARFAEESENHRIQRVNNSDKPHND
jgi:hypothetical protein